MFQHHLSVEILSHQLHPSIVVKSILNDKSLLFDLPRENLTCLQSLLFYGVIDFLNLLVHTVNLFFEVAAFLFNVVLQTLLLAMEFVLQVFDSFFNGFVAIL
jgi:uncharacterized membrane protein YfhO